MAEIDLVSSHTPWTPLPRMVAWNEVGDGSVFDAMPAQGQSPDRLWRNRDRCGPRTASPIQYSLERADLVRADLPRRQPGARRCSATTSRPRSSADRAASHDVPITIIAHDPSVMEPDLRRGAGRPGMLPDPQAPVWPMDAFRDRFLTAYGSHPPGPALSTSSAPR